MFQKVLVKRIIWSAMCFSLFWIPSAFAAYNWEGVDQPVPACNPSVTVCNYNSRPQAIVKAKVVPRAYYQKGVTFQGETIDPFVRYLVYVPAGYDSTNTTRKYPAIFCFPGAGQTTDSSSYLIDNLTQSLDKTLEAGSRCGRTDMNLIYNVNCLSTYPNVSGTYDSFVVFAPGVRNCLDPNGMEVKWLAAWVRNCVYHYNINPGKVYFTGPCAGSAFAYDVAAFIPNAIAAVATFNFPDRAGYDEHKVVQAYGANIDWSKIENIANIPWRLRANDPDPYVQSAFRLFVSEKKRYNSDPNLSQYSIKDSGTTGHNSWYEPTRGATYPLYGKSPMSMYAWFLSYTKSSPNFDPASVTSISRHLPSTLKESKITSGTFTLYTLLGKKVFSSPITNQLELEKMCDWQIANSVYYKEIKFNGKRIVFKNFSGTTK